MLKNKISRTALKAFLVVSFAGLLARTSTYANEMIDPPRTVVVDPLGMIPLLDTAAPNLRDLSEKEISEHEQSFTSKDGTKISGMFFKGTSKDDSPLPLIIANFGLFTDPHLSSSSHFIKSLVLNGRLAADIFVVNSNTSATFFAQNEEVGLGGYDEGRILIEVADYLKSNQAEHGPVYLVGVSLGGNAVIQALLEDQRLGLHHFSGAISFSGVLDEQESSQAIMTVYHHPLNLPKVQKIGFTGRVIINSLLSQVNETLKKEVLGFLPLKPKTAGQFFFRNFDKRLLRLGADTRLPNWNPAVDASNVEGYIRTSSALLHGVDHLKVPLIVVHAKNDDVVPFSQFKAFESETADQPNIQTLATDFGGHWGFFDTYGPGWVNDLIVRLENLSSSD